MTNQDATEAALFQPLTVDTEGLARLLGIRKSMIEHQIGERAWLTGELPVPFELGHRRRLWLCSAVVRRAEDRQARAESRLAPSGGAR